MKQTLTVLYVEDDTFSREIMHLLLIDMLGMENVTFFDSSRDFIERVHKLDPKPDLILLDIHVEPHTGFDMLKMLRADDLHKETPVVALTASVMNDEIQSLKEAGFSGVIAKPVDLDAFPILIDSVLQGENVWNILG